MNQTFRRPPSGPPLIMGILNVTPDSFSDGGCWTDVDAAVRHAFEMIDQGADIIDVGGESTRPNSEPVSAEEEIARLEPVLRELIPSIDVPVSVDTMKAAVAERCIGLGASIINDVYGLRDEGMVELCASTGVHVVIMHMNGMPKHMPASMEGDFMNDIRSFLRGRCDAALDAGMRRDCIILDPGIGFGKDPEQNWSILNNSAFFSDGYPVLSASSRKRFLAVKFPDMDRDGASAAAARIAADSGADMVRVHDVARTRVTISESLQPRSRWRSRCLQIPRSGTPSASRPSGGALRSFCNPHRRTIPRTVWGLRSRCSANDPGVLDLLP